MRRIATNGVTARHVELARQISAVAREQGALADPAGNEADIATTIGRG
jgi:hypothetical protein